MPGGMTVPIAPPPLVTLSVLTRVNRPEGDSIIAEWQEELTNEQSALTFRDLFAHSAAARGTFIHQSLDRTKLLSTHQFSVSLLLFPSAAAVAGCLAPYPPGTDAQTPLLLRACAFHPRLARDGAPPPYSPIDPNALVLDTCVPAHRNQAAPGSSAHLQPIFTHVEYVYAPHSRHELAPAAAIQAKMGGQVSASLEGRPPPPYEAPSHPAPAPAAPPSPAHEQPLVARESPSCLTNVGWVAAMLALFVGGAWCLVGTTAFVCFSLVLVMLITRCVGAQCSLSTIACAAIVSPTLELWCVPLASAWPLVLFVINY